LNIAIAEINAKTDLNIALESLEQAEHGRVAELIFAIRARTVAARTNHDSRPPALIRYAASSILDLIE
jgi:hypothetical protein